MKKGQTESYSFLIGIIITVLILTAIGCATYNAFRPQGKDSFEKLTSLLEKLEKEDIDESGEFPFYVEKDEVLLGFGIGREFIGKEGFWSIFNWECYGITFAWGAGTPFGITGKITRPEDKCPLDKSCLCLCEIVSVVTTYGIKETACQGESVKCAVFDTLDFLGGEGCKPGVFIPGRKGESEDERKPRGLSSIYYTKKGNTVSIDDKMALTAEEIQQEKESCSQFDYMTIGLLPGKCQEAGKSSDYCKGKCFENLDKCIPVFSGGKYFTCEPCIGDSDIKDCKDEKLSYSEELCNHFNDGGEICGVSLKCEWKKTLDSDQIHRSYKCENKR